MPVYVYRNLRTGETFEFAQRISEPALTEHPESGDPVKRLVQPVGIAFKGSGFYVTDSRKDTGKKSKGKDSDGAKSEKTEAKAEAKSEGSATSTSDSASSKSGGKVSD